MTKYIDHEKKQMIISKEMMSYYKAAKERWCNKLQIAFCLYGEEFLNDSEEHSDEYADEVMFAIVNNYKFVTELKKKYVCWLPKSEKRDWCQYEIVNGQIFTDFDVSNDPQPCESMTVTEEQLDHLKALMPDLKFKEV